MIYLIIFFVLSIPLFVWLIYKFTIRDPERNPPETKGVIVAPADGKIVYIKKIEKGTIPYSEKKKKKIPVTDSTKDIKIDEGYLIGIWMTYLNVHVQRVPITGIVQKQIYHPGKFLDPKFQPDYQFVNERNIISIFNEKLSKPVIIIQIASITVRRIVSFLQEKMSVQIGDRLGMIKFGSQVDIVIPAASSIKLNIKLGDHVTAGETIIARY